MLKKVTLVQNLSTDPDSAIANRVAEFFNYQAVELHHLTVAGKDCPEVPPEAAEPDLVIVLGGDGTFLRVARKFALQQIPLVGVNTGKLGFLTHIEADRLLEYLVLLMAGQYTLEERMLLSIHNDSHSECDEELALNDIVIKNANPSQLCTLKLFLNETLVAVYDADGLILSTPTGTTAYTMAAGGPVISPEVQAISITPICPHSFSAKAIVVPPDKDFRIESHTQNHDVVYALDGLECGTLKAGESMRVVQSPRTLKMVNFNRVDDDFYVLLKKKLHWSINPRWKTEEGGNAGSSPAK